MTPKLTKLRDELSRSFTNNYVTMNNRPPHRPDVMQYCFQKGFDAASAELLPVLKDLIKASDEFTDCFNNNLDLIPDHHLRRMEGIRINIELVGEAIDAAREKLGME